MGDFFKVGARYSNRIGEYEVIDVKTPFVQIRYTANNRLQEVEEELQERIVRNLLREQEIANKPPEAKRTAADRPRTQRRKRAKFEGFVREDFTDKTTGGTNWRAKTGLAGWLSDALADRIGADFDSWAPQRQSTVYVTAPDQCGTEHLADSGQYFVSCSQSGLSFGLQVKRPADSTEGMSAWDRLLGALSDDETLASTLNELLVGRAAELSWYGDAWGPSEKQTVRGEEEGLTFGRGNATEMESIEGLIERLQDAPQDQGVTLQIENSLDTDVALAGGVGAAETILDLMVQLSGFYSACTG